MENKEYNKYTPVDVPNIPTENDVSAIIDQQGRQAADSFVPLSDPTVDLPTAQNVQPFEGDPVPFDLPGISVKNHIVGSPDEQPGGYGVASDDDITNWIQTNQRDVSDSQGEYAQTFMYDAGPKTNSFYKRYAAYGDDKFSEIGFHPFVDNEANFTQRTTMADDWSRMLSHSFPVLLKRGFLDGPKSFVKALTGNYSGADLDDSEEYANAAAIGQSSREGGLTGFSAFMNNTVMNFGYTAGIITEALLEEVALSFMTIGSRGMTAGIQAQRTGQIGKDLLKAFGKFGTGARQITKLIPKISKNPASARGYWSSLRTAGRGVGKILNPLENTTDVLRGFAASQKAFRAGKATSYMNGIGLASKTAGSLYRDARAINMAVSEARLEAGMVENDIYKILHDDFFKENKYVPSAEEQVKMRIRAKQGSLETFYANAGIIYVTNQITFRNVVAPKGGLKNFMKGVQQELKSPKFSSKYGTLGKLVYDKGKNAVRFEKNKLKALAKSWYREPGLKTVKKTLGYFKANVSEGIQENLQETIARANIAHYVDMFKTQGVSSALYAQGVNGVTYQAQMGTSADRYGKEFQYEITSKQGLETFASGFMMGFFAKPLNNAVPFLSKHHNRIFDKQGYQTWIKTKAKEQKRIKDYLNEKFSKEGVSAFLDNRLFNLATQEKIGDILRFGDKKESLDAAVDQFVEQASIMTEYGAENMFVEKLEHMLEMNDAELADAVQSLDESQAPKYRERISKAISMIENMEAISKSAEKVLGANPIKDSDIDFSIEGLADQENIQKILLKGAWDRSVRNYIYINAAFQDTAKRMDSIYQDYLKNTSLANVDYGAVKVLFLAKDIEAQKNILKTEIEVNQKNSQKVSRIKKQLELLNNFTNAKQAFNELYNIDETLDVVEKEVKTLYKKAGKENVKPTAEEIESQAENKAASITEEQQIKVIRDLKDAHDKYIKFLAKTNDSTLFQTNLDDAFNKLLDFYKLRYENRFLAESIDVLTDPGGFLLLVEENAKAQAEVFSKKEEIVDELIDNEIKGVTFNGLLNKLHKIGLGLSQEDSDNLQNNNTPPKAFIGDDTSKKFEEGSPEFNAGMKIVNDYLNSLKVGSQSVNPVTGENMSEKQADVVKKLNALFALSKNYVLLQGKKKSTYQKDEYQYSRVSDIISEFIGETFDYAFIPQIIKNKDSIFNSNFKQKDKFTLTKKTIYEFINELSIDLQSNADDSIKGIDTAGMMAITGELDALLDQTERPFIREKIQRIEDQIKNIKNDEAVEKSKKEIANLEKQLILEPTEENTRKVLEEVISSVGYQSSRDRGNNLDDMVRDYFDRTIKNFEHKNYEKLITKNAFDKMFGENGLLKSLKDLQNSGDVVIFSKNLTLGSAEMSNKKNAAGTMDLVVVDKTGKTYIIDLKSMEASSANMYGQNLTYGGKNYAKHAMQLLAYSNLLFNETGIDAETLVLPIATTQKGTKITSIEQPKKSSKFITSKSDTIVKGKLFVDVNRKTKGANTKIVLGDKVKTNKETIDINDVDTLIPRGDSKTKPGSKEKPEVKVEFTKSGNVITLGKTKIVDEGFVRKVLQGTGKLMYITLGIGGNQIVKNNPNDFAHTDDILEKVLKDLGYAKRKDEKLNQYIARFVRNEDKESPLEGSKTKLYEKVEEEIEKLTDDNKIVITSSPNLIANVPSDSLIVIAPIDNTNFLNSFANEADAINFKSKEQVAIKGKNDKTSLEITEFKELIEFTNDSLYLYKELDKKDFSFEQRNDLKAMIDIKANSLLDNSTDLTISTTINQPYTLISDLKSTDLKTGDQLTVFTIDTKNRDVTIKQSKPGSEFITIPFSNLLDSLVKQDSSLDGNKDKANSEAVAEYLKSLDAEKSKIDKNPKDFKVFSGKSPKENFEIFKCG